MSRSNRTSRSTRSSSSTGSRGVVATPATPNTATATPSRNTGRRDNRAAKQVASSVNETRQIQNYVFQFTRSNARKKGCNSVRIESVDGTTQQLTLAEARSLYNFLAGQFAGV